MAQVKIWNDNVHPYKEQFQDELIEIPAKKFIVMEEKKAVRFRGTYCSPVLDHDGNPMPESFKMLRLEHVDASAPEKEEMKFLCHACGSDEFQSQKALDAHIDASHTEIQADTEYKEEKAKKKQGKESHA